MHSDELEEFFAEEDNEADANAERGPALD